MDPAFSPTVSCPTLAARPQIPLQVLQKITACSQLSPLVGTGSLQNRPLISSRRSDRRVFETSPSSNSDSFFFVLSQGSLGEKRSQSSSRKPSQPRARAPKARALASRNAPSAPKEADTEKKMASRLWEKFLADEEYVGAGAVDLTGDEDISAKPMKMPDANVRKFLFADVEFVKSAVNEEDYPLIKDSKGKTMPEVAIAGRSNVGKSSMINHLVKRKSLARTSSTPGATRHINFYSSKNELVLVDLPGYGFASVSSAEKESWGEMCERYLATREPLKAMLLLVDVRRDPTPDDMQLRDWAMQVFEKPCVLVLTKCDQVPPSRLQSHTESVLRAYGWEGLPFVNYSIKDAAAKDRLNFIIAQTLNQSR